MVQATQVKFTNGSVIRAVSSDYKGQAGGRQRLTIFDEIWAFDHERMTRLFEEMTLPPSEPGAYILIVSYAGFTSEGELLENLYKRGLAGKRIHKSLDLQGSGAVHVLEPQAEATVAAVADGSRGTRLLR